jgi:hypothetical protein
MVGATFKLGQYQPRAAFEEQGTSCYTHEQLERETVDRAQRGVLVLILWARFLRRKWTNSVTAFEGEKLQRAIFSN